jgi:hypothetical protein
MLPALWHHQFVHFDITPLDEDGRANRPKLECHCSFAMGFLGDAGKVSVKTFQTRAYRAQAKLRGLEAHSCSWR